MELIARDIVIPHPRTEIKIVAMGCVQHGAAGCDERLAQFWYDYILRTPHAYVILGGDLVDSIHEKDRRYAEQEVAEWCLGTKANRAKWGSTLIDRQYRYALKKWEPLAKAGKILWIHKGNHEEKLVATASRDLTLDWCRALKVPYAGLAALSLLRVKHVKRRHESEARFSVSFFSQHGGGGAQSDGGIINKAGGMLAAWDVDVALMWHLHRKTHLTRRMLGITRSLRRAVRDRVGAVCGTFLDGHCEGVDSYAELKGYPPVVTGPLVIHIRQEDGFKTLLSDPGRATSFVRLWVSDAVRGGQDGV